MDRGLLIAIVFLLIIIIITASYVVFEIDKCNNAADTTIYECECCCEEESACNLPTDDELCDTACIPRGSEPQILSFDVAYAGADIADVPSFSIIPEPDAAYINATWSSTSTTPFTFYILEWQWENSMAVTSDEQAWLITQGELGVNGGYGSTLPGIPSFPVAADRCQVLDFSLTAIGFGLLAVVDECELELNTITNNFDANVRWTPVVATGCLAPSYYVFSRALLDIDGVNTIHYHTGVQIANSTSITFPAIPAGTYDNILNHECRVLAMFDCSLNSTSSTQFEQIPCVT